jgi:hypothetical protein
MPIQTDYIAFHKSLADEIKATKDQVRNLIGSKHWLTDGEYKEIILRKILRNRLPNNFRVGRGFICWPDRVSTQIDILITYADKPVMFREGDLSFVTPDCVAAIIEVKTKLTTRQEFLDVLGKLATEVEFVRQDINRFNNANIHPCWGGLFVFEDPILSRQKKNEETLLPKCEALLSALGEATGINESRAINCVSLGSDVFARYWLGGTEFMGGFLHNSGWHSYLFQGRHKGLSPAYFVGNLVMDLQRNNESQPTFAWFPIQDQGGKEQYKTHYIQSGEHQVHQFLPIG